MSMKSIEMAILFAFKFQLDIKKLNEYKFN